MANFSLCILGMLKGNIMRKTYSFGYDIDNIENVMIYVMENYFADDYHFLIGSEDDVMNGLEIEVNKNGDDELEELINSCDGKGNYVE
jgi:hypothetical protein